MFSYEVLSEEEALKAREFQLLEEGIYNFKVESASFTYSTSGNPMIKLTLVIKHDGKEFRVFDNLIGTRNMIWKLKHFADTTGLTKTYESGNFSFEVCRNQQGKCSIGKEDAKPKNDGTNGIWKAKNIVVDYVTSDFKLPNKAATNPFAPPSPKKEERAPTVEDFDDSDIPF